MLNLELQKYIDTQLAAGITADQLKTTLLQAGWPAQDIADSMPKTQAASILPPLDVKPTVEDHVKSVSEAKPVKKRKSKLFLFILLLVFLLAGGFAGVYAYTTYMEYPVRVFAEMAKRSSFRSYSYDSTVVMEGKASGSSNSTVTVNAVGDLDVKDEKNPITSTTLSLEYKVDQNTGMAAAQFMYLANMLYFRVTQLPDLGEYTADTADYMNKWFSVSATDLAGFGMVPPTATEEKISEEQAAQIRDAFIKNKCIILSKNIPSTEVSGIATYHYQYTIDKKCAVPFTKDVAIIMKQELTNNQITQIGDAMDMFQQMKGEIWVGKNDYMPYRTTFSTAVNDGKGNVDGKVSIHVNLKNFGNIPQITAPADVTKVNDAIADAERKLSEQRNTQRSADVLKIQDAMYKYLAVKGHALSDFGVIPFCTATPAKISAPIVGLTPAGTINLQKTLVYGYLSSVPEDPQVGTSTDTGYTICKTASGKLQISAPHAENGKVISVVR